MLYFLTGQAAAMVHNWLSGGTISIDESGEEVLIS